MAAPSSSSSTTPQQTSKNAANQPKHLQTSSPHQNFNTDVDVDPQDKQHQSDAFGQLELPRRSPCPKCSNISIMHLFHEMKQEFRTVPDEIVSACVSDNCHNRAALYENLRREAEHQPQSQVYPAQALQQHTKRPVLALRKIGPQAPAKPTFTKSLSVANTPSSNSSTQSGGVSSSSNSSRSSSITEVTTTTTIQGEEYFNAACSLQNEEKRVNFIREGVKDDCTSDGIGVGNTIDVTGNVLLLEKLQRPTTLSLTPTRHAPPPPTPTPSSVGLTSSTSSTESLNVSLNVTVSPVAGRPPMRPPRHTSALSMKPETPYLSPTSAQRSYTSVNFTLRKPVGTNVAQSPIDITAGPGLTYSSASYDARQGYQSSLQITVGGSGQNTISASRMRPQSCYNMANVVNEEEEELDVPSSTSIRTGVSMPNFSQVDFRNSNSVQPTIPAEAALQVMPQQSKKFPDIMKRQLMCKDSLANELDSTRRQRDVIEREISALQSPIPVGGTTQLQQEIEQLRWNCDRMAHEVMAEEQSLSLGEVNEAFYQNIYTGQRLPMRSNRPPRPPRPPPPIRPAPPIPSMQELTHSSSMQQPEWSCNMCTFLNNALLNKCEQCEMPRLPTGTTSTQEMQRQTSAPARLIAHHPSQPYSTPSPIAIHNIPHTSFEHFTRNLSYDPNHSINNPAPSVGTVAAANIAAAATPERLFRRCR